MNKIAAYEMLLSEHPLWEKSGSTKAPKSPPIPSGLVKKFVNIVSKMCRHGLVVKDCGTCSKSVKKTLSIGSKKVTGTKEASADQKRKRQQYYMRNRHQILQKQRQYRQRNKAQIALKQKMYRRQVGTGAKVQRKRITTGHSYTYGGYR